MDLILYVSLGIIIGLGIYYIITRMGLNKNQQKAELIIKEANIKNL